MVAQILLWPLHLPGFYSYNISTSTFATSESKTTLGNSPCDTQPGLEAGQLMAVWSTHPEEPRDPEGKLSHMPSGWLVLYDRSQRQPSPHQKKKLFLFYFLLAPHKNNSISNVSTARSPEGPITNLLRLLTQK